MTSSESCISNSIPTSNFSSVLPHDKIGGHRNDEALLVNTYLKWCRLSLLLAVPGCLRSCSSVHNFHVRALSNYTSELEKFLNNALDSYALAHAKVVDDEPSIGLSLSMSLDLSTD